MISTRLDLSAVVVADGFFPQNDNYDPINGYAPSSPGLVAGATWISDGAFRFRNSTGTNYDNTANSAGVVGGPGGGGVWLYGYVALNDGAALPIPALQTGNIYTLSADVILLETGSPASTGFAYVGFYSVTLAGSPGAIFTLGSAQAGSTVGDPGDGTGASLPSGSLSGMQTVTFTINTAAPAWTYSATVGSMTLISNQPYASTPTDIDSIVLGLDTNGDQYPEYWEAVANLSVTAAAAPEPATIGSLLGGLGMLTVLRFRRK